MPSAGHPIRTHKSNKTAPYRRASLEARELEATVVEAVGDHDVVGEVAVVDEEHRVVLVAGDALSAQSRGRSPEIGLLELQVAKPLGEVLGVLRRARDGRDPAHGPVEDPRGPAELSGRDG